MVLLENLVCPECGKDFQGVRTQNQGTLCSTCIEAKEREAKENWLKEWRNKLSLEARVAKIEEWIFEHQDLVEEVRWDGPIR
jgi:hypothetical protein